MRFLVPLIFIAATLTSCSDQQGDTPTNQFSDPEIQNLFEHGLQRNAASVTPFLQHPNPEYRRVAAIQLGSIQDTSSLRFLIDQLSDSVDAVQEAVCFALGQFQSPEALDALIEFATNHNPVQHDGEAFVSLGKMAARSELARHYQQRIADAFHGYRPESEIQFINWARGVLYLNKAGFAFREIHLDIRYHMQTCGGKARVIMAQGLAGAPYDWVGENTSYFNQWLRTERADEVRIPMMTLLSKLNNEESAKLLVGYAATTSASLPLSIAAVNALAEIKSLTPALIAPLFNHDSEQVVEALLGVCRSRGICVDPQLLNHRLERASISHQVGLLSALGRCDDGRALENLNALLEKTNDPYEKAAILSELATDQERAPSLFSNYVLSSSHPIIRYTTLDGILSAQSGFSSTFTRKQWVSAWNTGDAGAWELLANWIARRGKKADNLNDLIDLMQASLKTCTLPRDIETYDAVAAACTALGRPESPAARSGYALTDWNYIKSLPRMPELTVETTAGSFSLVLFTDDAPVSVAQFIRLARSGFYNGKPVHRVVPNFVIQSGCPRGDGMGSLEELIRSEFTPAPFYRGSLGFASAGKDTESCQWFVTQLNTFHLDGRYTRFGEVTSGMDVVERIRRGDRILSIKEK